MTDWMPAGPSPSRISEFVWYLSVRLSQGFTRKSIGTQSASIPR